MENNLKKSSVMWLVASFCCLLWGSAFPMIKVGYKLLEIDTESVPSVLLFAGVRFFLAGVLTVIIFSFIKRKPLFPSKHSVKSISVLALFQTVIQYVFFYLGLAYTSGERGSVINGASVFFAILISALIFKSERLTVNKIAGSLIGFSGVILVSLDAFTKNGGGIKGEAFILLSSVSYAFSSNFIKKYSQHDDPAMLSGWQFMLGGAVMTVFGLLFGGKLNAVNVKGIAVIIYLAFLSAFAYSLWSILLKYNDVSRVTVCSFLIPVFGFILSSLITKGEKAGLIASSVALVLVAAGIIIVNTGGRNEKKKYNGIEVK